MNAIKNSDIPAPLTVDQLVEQIDWKKVDGLVPAIVQDVQTRIVLMLGYMNEEALRKTVETGKATFWTRTRQRLWTKGESSGNVLTVSSITPDCDNDTLLVKATPVGPTCHTGDWTCWKEEQPVPEALSPLSIVQELYALIEERAQTMPQGSYTTKLLEKPVNKLAAKLGEELMELAVATLTESDERVTEESVDVLYHLFVLLVKRNIPLETVLAEMRKRRK